MDLNRCPNPSAFHFFVLEIEMEISNQPPTSHWPTLPRSLLRRFGTSKENSFRLFTSSLMNWVLSQPGRGFFFKFQCFFSVIKPDRQYKIVISSTLVPRIFYAILEIQY